MTELLKWLRQNKFRAYLAAFLLMVLTPVPLFYAARQQAGGWIWFLLGLFILANMLALIVH